MEELIIRKPNEFWTEYLVMVLRGEKYPIRSFSELSSIDNDRVDLFSGTRNNKIELDLNRGICLGDLLEAFKPSSPALNLKELVDESVTISSPRGGGMFFDINQDGTISTRPDIDLGVEQEYITNFFPYYNNDKKVDGDVFINDILMCIGQFDIKSYEPRICEGSSEGSLGNDSEDRAHLRAKELDKEIKPSKLDEILKSVKRLEKLVCKDPFQLEFEKEYLERLYVRTINENIGNLRIFSYKGQKIPYVLVHSRELEGKPGKPYINLYFVAEDKAREEWQQKIVAYHESICARIGHDEARKREYSLVKHLGKEKEYREWISKI